MSDKYVILYALTNNPKLKEIYMRQCVAEMRRKNLLPIR